MRLYLGYIYGATRDPRLARQASGGSAQSVSQRGVIVFAYSLRKLLKEALSQLQLVVGSLCSLRAREWLHLVYDFWLLLCSLAVGLAFLQKPSILLLLFLAYQDLFFSLSLKIAQQCKRILYLSSKSSLYKPVCMLVALDVSVPWNPRDKDLILCCQRLAQLCYLKAIKAVS